MAFQPTYQRPSYGRCSSYFVESVDDGLYAQRAHEREMAKQASRQRQRELAEDLSRMTSEDYQDDILEHMERMEVDTCPDVNAIDIQTEIQWFMRPYLLDFLIEAHAAFQLLPETLHLAVNLLDRYCSKRVVYKRHYQLVGCSALLIAAKYGDRKDRVPTVRELKSMCCGLYEDEMFTQMEWHVLVTLDWAVGHPTVDSFLQLALCEVAYDAEVEHMTWYMCEMAMFHKDFVSTLPSVMARSALALARCVLSRSVDAHTSWASTFDSATVLALSLRISRPSAVLSKKYASPHYSHVSTTLDNFFRQQARLAQLAAQPPPTPPVDVGFATDKPGFQGPHTPQKGQYPADPQQLHQQQLQQQQHYGYMTPPITPEGDIAGASGYPRYVAAVCPGTPTPPSSSGESYPMQPYHSYANLAAPQQTQPGMPSYLHA